MDQLLRDAAESELNHRAELLGTYDDHFGSYLFCCLGERGDGVRAVHDSCGDAHPSGAQRIGPRTVDRCVRLCSDALHLILGAPPRERLQDVDREHLARHATARSVHQLTAAALPGDPSTPTTIRSTPAAAPATGMMASGPRARCAK